MVWRNGQRFVRERWPQVSVLFLLAIMAANLLTVIERKSITIDEIAHIPAGYYHLVAGNYTLNNEHPPLVKLWAALPLLFLQPNEPPLAPLADADFYARTGAAFANFWTANASAFEEISFWTRVPMIVLTLILGWTIFVFAKDLAGPRAGVLAVALFSLDPSMLAHGRIIHTDLPAALAYLFFALTLYRYHDRPSFRSALVVGLAAGAGLVTKFSLVLVGPLSAVAMAAWILRASSRGLTRGQVIRHALTAGLVALAVINLVYRFQRQPIVPADLAWIIAKTPEHAEAVMNGIRAFSVLFPNYFLFGIYNVVIHNHAGHAGFLLGHYRDTGWWYYFPVVFALKATLPFLALSLAACVWGFVRLVSGRDARLLFLLGPLALYIGVSLTSGINIGVRHFLPVYPFLFILAALLLDWFLRVSKRRYAAATVVALLIAAMGLETVRAYPDYVTYLNQFRGNRPGWQLLSDSNVEWGDDIKAVSAYLRARGETRVTGATSAGWLTFRFFGIDYVDLCPPRHVDPIETKYVAIGAGFLNGSTVPGSAVLPEVDRENYFAAYRDRKPEAVFGTSIYLYRVK
jgi:4-amino-4-deoxy-L-arabinose transferase-like glycosyltransferase